MKIVQVRTSASIAPGPCRSLASWTGGAATVWTKRWHIEVSAYRHQAICSLTSGLGFWALRAFITNVTFAGDALNHACHEPPPLPPPALPPDDVLGLQPESLPANQLPPPAAPPEEPFPQGPGRRLRVKTDAADASQIARKPQRSSRESWANFFARYHMHYVDRLAHGRPQASQKEYRNRWAGLTTAEQAAFQKEHAATTGAPTEIAPCSQSVNIPESYDFKSLVAEFTGLSGSHAAILGNDDGRWLLYCKVALMVKRGDFKTATAAEQQCKSLRVTRQKLMAVLAMLEQGPLSRECPPTFKSGAKPHASLTLQEKEDLLQMVKFHAQCALPFTIRDVERAIMCFRMAREGILRFHWDTAEELADKADAMCAKYAPSNLWQNFRLWVKENKPQSEWLLVKRLKQKPVEHISAVSDKVIIDSFNEIESMLLDSGIAVLVDGVPVLQKSQCHRLAITDEKGVSQRQDDVTAGIVHKGQASRAKAVAPEMSWAHVTFTSFLPMVVPEDLPELPVGIVVPFTKALDLVCRVTGFPCLASVIPLLTRQDVNAEYYC
ncbi:unnamed protein product [Symbiodinium sp. CCMP2456]|nr:unnamed protein product [Symbiodinium sp. CCMP2456]